MARDRLQGKLVVILHADVAGSTELVQRDEQRAHERIRETFERLGNDIQAYGGRVLELRGDALLAEFERASDAVSAALAFQSGHRRYAAGFDDDIRPELRIGIAMGEVVIADNTVTGAGVVLAQRVEAETEPGGLCVTAAIHEALPGRMPFVQQRLGEKQLKGFEEPVQIYRIDLRPGASLPPPAPVRGGGLLAAIRGRGAVVTILVLALALAIVFWPAARETLAPPTSGDSPPISAELPTIAVLPFDNMSEDPAQQYFSDGIAEDIITDLSQLRNLAVISRNSSFSYRGASLKAQEIGRELGANFLLEGSVRKAGSQIRINAQLIDAGNGHHLWAERFDRELVNVFELQDEITRSIVAALSIQLSGDEQRQLAHDATSNFEAYDLFLQGREYGTGYTADGLARAVEVFRRAIDLDPGFARAYGGLAIAVIRQVLAGYSDAPAEGKKRALDLAQKAVSLDPDSPQALWALGYVYMYRNQFDEAIEVLDRAIALSPSYADAYALMSLIRNNQGQAAEAIRLIEKGMALNPHYSWDYLYNLGRAYYALGEQDKAVEYLQQALSRNEAPTASRVFLIAALARLERQDDAEWEVEQLGLFHPEVDLQHLQQTLPITDRELKERLLQDLRAAGLE